MALVLRKFLIVTISLLVNWSNLFCQVSAPTKIWRGNDKNDGALHALGNGKMLIYEDGANIFEVKGGPYSTPSLFKLKLMENALIETASSREQGTAIWTHEVFSNGKSMGTFVDFVDSELPCMIRRFILSGTLQFKLELMDYVEILPEPTNKNLNQRGNLRLMVPVGNMFFEKHAYPKPLYHQIAWKGNAKVEQVENKKNEYIITVTAGESEFYVIGGPEYPQVVNNWEEIQQLSYTKLLDRTRHWWNTFTANRIDFTNELSKTLPLRQKLLQTIDDVSVMIRTQQAQEGAVMAGYRYPMGYVRDQYGVSRGLLALGYFQEAKHILEFYWNIWKKYGEIHNAQGIGVEGVFHVFENDEVEITGYLVLQAFDLLEKSGDEEFMEKIFPMLVWSWDVQKKHLVKGMLPFNGDETYVAGGFLPRSALNDGSAEATMLFIEGGEKLIDWVRKHKKWTSDKIEIEKDVLKNTKKLFYENFWKNGQLLTNNPERASIGEMPRFRHGACEMAGLGCLVAKRNGISGVDWTERDANNRYQCPACLALGPLPKIEPHAYNLVSVGFTPFYMHSSLFSPEDLRPVVEKVYKQYDKTGILSCNIDSSAMNKNTGTVGYDYGYLLFAMLETGMEGTETIYEQALAVTDSAGVWSEYYSGNVPYLTRYRPWESAINIEALLQFANQYKK